MECYLPCSMLFHNRCMNLIYLELFALKLWSKTETPRDLIICSLIVFCCNVTNGSFNAIACMKILTMGISTININETLANAFQDLLIISDQTLAFILFAFEIHAFGFMTLFLWIFTFTNYETMEHFRRLCLNNNRFPFLDKFIRLMCLNYAHSRGQSKVSNVFMKFTRKFTSYESVLQQIL